jgi:hypothetical protein
MVAWWGSTKDVITITLIRTSEGIVLGLLLTSFLWFQLSCKVFFLCTQVFLRYWYISKHTFAYRMECVFVNLCAPCAGKEKNIHICACTLLLALFVLSCTIPVFWGIFLCGFG